MCVCVSLVSPCFYLSLPHSPATTSLFSLAHRYKYDSPGWKHLEFLQFCEAAGVPTCVLTLPVTETVTDLVDFIEYSFGGSDTEWGALRVQDGREEPYKPFLIEIGNENTMNFTGPELNPCRDECSNFLGRWVERALAMDAKAAALGLSNTLKFIVGFDAAPGSQCTVTSIDYARDSILKVAKLAKGLGRRAIWDCHVGGDSPSDGNVTGLAMAHLQAVLRNASSEMLGVLLYPKHKNRS